MSIKMLKIHGRNDRIYLSSEPDNCNPVIHYNCTQEITDPEFIQRWVDYLRSRS